MTITILRVLCSIWGNALRNRVTLKGFLLRGKMSSFLRCSNASTDQCSNNSSKLRSEKAFTLLEVLATLGFLAILQFIAVPAYLELTYSFHKRDALQNLRGDIRRAREEAVMSGARVVIEPNADSSQYKVGIDRYPYGASPVIEEELFSRNLPSETTINLSGDFIFNPKGFLIQNSGAPVSVTYTLTHRGNQFTQGIVYSTGSIEKTGS